MKYAIIIGAGPAGLTAAYELLKRTDIIPIVLEKSGDIGGISKTVNYKGNRIDIGGHRFFSKSDRVMKWWLNIMPLEQAAPQEFVVNYQNKSRILDRKGLEADAYSSKDPDNVLLLRKRLSRIYFLRKFFTYPIQLSFDTLHKLGVSRTVGIIFSYLKAQLFPRKPERSLEDFMINRFGVKLYQLFFKDYTEKVWGVPCQEISAEWGAQRIKGVSISKTIQHAITKALQKKKTSDLSQKGTETSLIEQFLYPKYGPGQLWEEVARQVQAMGGQIHLHQDVDHIYTNGNQVTAVSTKDSHTGQPAYHEGDYFFSTMPVKELIAGLQAAVPDTVQELASGLQYRDFITVGVLLRRLEPVGNQATATGNTLLPDTWIYVQEKDVRVGRLQIFNNWSPYMVKDPNTVWIGMEYFCNKGDGFWELSENELKRIGVTELEKMGLARVEYVIDTTVIRMENTYPAYFGTYTRFSEIREYTDLFQNLFLVGRNGMHKYNNSDHSMLTAMVAVDNIIERVSSKENIWSINTEQEYHEEKNDGGSPNDVAQPLSGAKLDKKSALTNVSAFQKFLLSNPLNKRLGIFAIFISVIFLGVFKYFYPYPGFYNGDSYSYINSAFLNQRISTYPTGYPTFLRVISVFTTSGNIVVCLQFLLLQGSGLFFLSTCAYLFQINKWMKIGLTVFFCINPVNYYLANYILSDSLFISLSTLWFTTLLWILFKPSSRLILWHTLFIFAAFTIRYNALYYPVVSCIAFLLSKERLALKLGGVFLSILFIGLFIENKRQRYYTLTGTYQFTPFSGWQMANNAMYVYRFVPGDSRKPVPNSFKKLDEAVRNYFDTSKDLVTHPTERQIASTAYMWSPHSPLNYYKEQVYGKDSAQDRYINWAKIGPFYGRYGLFLIQAYPVEFFKYYLWPNTIKYYTPPVEFLETYNSGVDTILQPGMQWFGYPKKLKTRTAGYKVSILKYHPILTAVINVLFICNVIGFLFLHGYKKNSLLCKSALLAIVFFLMNLGFSVFASPIALRFQLFPSLVYLYFAVILLDKLVQMARHVPDTDYLGREKSSFPFNTVSIQNIAHNQQE